MPEMDMQNVSIDMQEKRAPRSRGSSWVCWNRKQRFQH